MAGMALSPKASSRGVLTSNRIAAFAALMLALGAGIGGCVTSSTGSVDTNVDVAVQRGRLVAARDCAGCHAIDVSAESPRPSAPPFRDIRRRYNRVSLTREFIAIGQGGHYQMPPTQISSSDSADLIAFIESLGP
jgi:mono/diheme cytochrome c family protein